MNQAVSHLTTRKELSETIQTGKILESEGWGKDVKRIDYLRQDYFSFGEGKGVFS